MTNIFSNTDLFRTINEYTNLQSLCDTCTLLLTLKKYINYKLNKYELELHKELVREQLIERNYDDVVIEEWILHIE